MQSPLRRNTDLVSIEVKVDGSIIPDAVLVENIIVQKEVNRISTAKIVLLDGDPAQQDFALSADDLFIPGKEIEILAGYHSDNAVIYKGIIIKHSLKIRNNQNSSLIIECKHKAIKMTVGRKSKYFYDSTDSAAIEELISNTGLAFEVTDTQTTHPELVQYQTTDWDFMMARAEANGKLCITEDDKIKIVDPDFNQAATLSITYGNDMIAFDAEIDARDQYKSVVSKAWDYSNQQVMDAEAQITSPTPPGNFTPDDLADVIGLDQLEIKHGGKADEAALKAWADAQLTRSRMAQVQGRVTFQGSSLVSPGQLLQLGGVGSRFNGDVFVSAVRHQISEGNWITDVQFGFNPEWFTETYEISQLPASGLSAAISGLQVGLVTQLADDPAGEDRIQVRLPMINAEEQGVWARVASLDAGENRGAFFRPEIGDEVILGFINDDPREAVVLGMLNSSAKPAPITASDDNHEKGFTTRSDMKLLFNDDEKSITIETPKGNKIILSEDDGSIEIQDENNNSIKMESGGITLDSKKDITIKANGDISIEGTSISIKANLDLKAQGGSAAEFSSSGVTELKGALVQIN